MLATMKLTIPNDKFIDPILRAFETMVSDNPDKDVIYFGHHIAIVLKETLSNMMPAIIQRETEQIEEDRRNLIAVLKDVQREIDAAGDMAFDVISPEVMGDIRYIINKIEMDNNESPSKTV